MERPLKLCVNIWTSKVRNQITVVIYMQHHKMYDKLVISVYKYIQFVMSMPEQNIWEDIQEMPQS